MTGLDLSALNLAKRYGLTVEEVHRALAWARTAKEAAQAREAYRAAERRPALFTPPSQKAPEKAWCQQCERRVFRIEAENCASPYCKAKAPAAWECAA